MNVRQYRWAYLLGLCGAFFGGFLAAEEGTLATWAVAALMYTSGILIGLGFDRGRTDNPRDPHPRSDA